MVTYPETLNPSKPLNPKTLKPQNPKNLHPYMKFLNKKTQCFGDSNPTPAISGVSRAKFLRPLGGFRAFRVCRA